MAGNSGNRFVITRSTTDELGLISAEGGGDGGMKGSYSVESAAGNQLYNTVVQVVLTQYILYTVVKI